MYDSLKIREKKTLSIKKTRYRSINIYFQLVVSVRIKSTKSVKQEIVISKNKKSEMTLTTFRKIVVIIAFVILSTVEVSSKTAFKTTIRKCCPIDQILDDRYKCVNVTADLSANETSPYVRSIFWDAICLNDKCNDLRFKTVNFKGCPVVQRVESNYLEAFPNGSLIFVNGPLGERTLVRQPTGCGVLTVEANPFDPPEGPVYIYCMGSGEGGPGVNFTNSL